MVPDRYRIKLYGQLSDRAKLLLPHSRIVTSSGTGLPHVPRPSLLEAHAAAARILHKIAIGKRIDKALQTGRIRCLAKDGATDVQSLVSVF